jgi:IS30 family transposase
MCKEYTQLTIRERYTIEDLIQEGKPQNRIAEKLGRSNSTISRELTRNGVPVSKPCFMTLVYCAQNISIANQV